MEKVDIPATKLLGASPNIVGNAKAPYEIVEFGDYECPFCRGAGPVLQTLLAKYPNDVKLDFRDLPLDSLHPHAHIAALVACAAAEQGKFEPVHADLLASKLDAASLHTLVKRDHVDETKFRVAFQSTAARHVISDVAAATSMSINQTPILFLITPDNTARRFDSVTKLVEFLTKQLQPNTKS